MKKILLLILAACLLVFLAYFAVNYDDFLVKGSRRELITDLPPLKCDLNKNPCEYDFHGHKVLVSFTPRPVPVLAQTRLKISNLGDYKDLNTKIYGLNMYMGTIVPSFKKKKSDYVADLFLSSCVLDSMRYRFEFYDKDKPLGFSFDLDVKR